MEENIYTCLWRKIISCYKPVLHDWCNKGYVLLCLWDDAYKRTLAANRKE